MKIKMKNIFIKHAKEAQDFHGETQKVVYSEDFEQIVEDIHALLRGCRIPTRRDLIVLAREYADEFYSLENSDNSIDINHLAIQDFYKMAQWLKNKGY